MSTLMGNKKKKKKSDISKKEYEDARAAAAFWETYAKMLEEGIAKQSKKNKKGSTD